MAVVDISELLQTEVRKATTSFAVMQKVTLCAVAFLTYLQSIVFQRERKANVRNAVATNTETINGLFILKTEGGHFNSHHIETLKNLYFYKTELCHDMELQMM